MGLSTSDHDLILYLHIIITTYNVFQVPAYENHLTTDYGFHLDAFSRNKKGRFLTGMPFIMGLAGVCVRVDVR